MALDPLFELPDIVGPDLTMVAEQILAIEARRSTSIVAAGSPALVAKRGLDVDKNFDLVVIGTGAAAGTVANRCRGAGWSVAIIDKLPFGGTCQLRGCDPKKVLRRAAEVGGCDAPDAQQGRA